MLTFLFKQTLTQTDKTNKPKSKTNKQQPTKQKLEKKKE